MSKKKQAPENHPQENKQPPTFQLLVTSNGKKWRPRKFKTSDDLRVAFIEYCELQVQNKRPITKTSFKAYILVAHGYFYGLWEEFSEALKKIDMVCKAYAEEELFVGKNVAGVIFNLTNNYPDEYKNKQYGEFSGKDGKPLFDTVRITIDNGAEEKQE